MFPIRAGTTDDNTFDKTYPAMTTISPSVRAAPFTQRPLSAQTTIAPNPTTKSNSNTVSPFEPPSIFSRMHTAALRTAAAFRDPY
jgi:hypothetical protein